jgi:hypothetical protein
VSPRRLVVPGVVQEDVEDQVGHADTLGQVE